MKVEVRRPGYVPRGAGVIELTVTPAPRGLQPVAFVEPGVVREVQGIALASHLAERHVSDRMASVCEEHLRAADVSCSIERILMFAARHNITAHTVERHPELSRHGGVAAALSRSEPWEPTAAEAAAKGHP